MSNIKSIPNNLRTHREQAGLRQIDVAEAFHLDCADRVSRWETGTAMPSVENLFRLAVLYGRLPHELYPELYMQIVDQVRSPAPKHTSSIFI